MISKGSAEAIGIGNRQRTALRVVFSDLRYVPGSIRDCSDVASFPEVRIVVRVIRVDGRVVIRIDGRQNSSQRRIRPLQCTSNRGTGALVLRSRDRLLNQIAN